MTFIKHSALKRTFQSLDMQLSYRHIQHYYEPVWRPLTKADCVDRMEVLVKTKEGEQDTPFFYVNSKWQSLWYSGYLLPTDIVAIRPLKNQKIK